MCSSQTPRQKSLAELTGGDRVKRVLLAGFKGKDNASKLILDSCPPELEKLYLENDFSICASQIETAVDSYDFIMILGQKPVIKSIYIEVEGKSPHDSIKTAFDCTGLADWLTAAGYKVRISTDAGNYLCNHVYYHGLKAANTGTQLVFLHVPYLKNIDNVAQLASTLSSFLFTLNYSGL